MFPVLLANIFIGGPAKYRLLWRTALPSVYIHSVLLLGEAQHGTLCRAIQVQQTVQSCTSATDFKHVPSFPVRKGSSSALQYRNLLER